ncbi:hypothetical protein [Faecalibacter rhinopitheci]|uniref:Uncharacterized protein n=1 Tax=Faecalibacter rhinopitheci TaxID=2779678 RepID=A0A8J7FPN6_9FLAO|nr:hypothetical protein [Faecalibacter rhinopitheci]MBF0598417.1 hypothetical protein [Faecalibacter rhinopitheci]
MNLGFICLTAFSSFLIISNEKSPVKIIHKSDNSWVEIYSMDRTVCICTESPEYCDEFCKESFIVQKIGIFNKKTKL